jgi:hypothetical protein
MEKSLTRAERLQAIIAAVAPATHAHHAENDGAWPQRADDDRPERFEKRVGDGVWAIDKNLTAADAAADPENVRERQRGAAPYVIETTAAGGRRLKVYAEDGGVYVGNGQTLEDALADLEAKTLKGGA